MMILSKKAQDMLEYNGYSYKTHDNQHVFKHSAIDSIGLTIILMITTLLVIALMIYNLFLGIGALLLSLFIFAPIVKRSKGKSQLKIDIAQEVLKINEGESKITKGFNEIMGVYTHSKFVDEYSSAFKSTSKEYQITIGLEIDQQQIIPLFKLIADHEKPSKEANEVHDFLESVLRNRKPTLHSQVE
ncbi:hypothetical protein [Ekhidna sp.]|uniref:hypothetical protein n=1 Tax=Ekhidna sp. TaxID=2608089 RepID=UPI003297E3F2